MALSSQSANGVRARRRGLLSVPLLFCIAVEVLLGWIMLPKLWEEWRRSHWTPTPAEVIDTRLWTSQRHDGQHFEPMVRYRYRFAGAGYTNDNLRESFSYRNAATAQEVMSRYPLGGSCTCYVDPGAPHRSVLQVKVQYWPLVMFLAPLLLWVLLDLRRLSEWWDARLERVAQSGLQPFTANAALKKTRRSGLLISIFCLAMATLFCVWAWAWPIWSALGRTRAWVETPCAVQTVQIVSETRHNGISFKPEVQFEYTFAGKRYIGSELDCSSDTGLGRAEAERRLKGIEPGASHCFVNPQNPTQAVLRRTFYIDRFFGPFAAVFLLGGLVMVGSAIRALRRRRPTARKTAEIPITANLRHVSPALLLSCWLLAALACLGGAAWVGWLCWQEYQRGVLSFIEALYVLMLGFGALYSMSRVRLCWWGCLSPPPQIQLTPGIITLGHQAEVTWTFRHDGSSRDSVRFWLEGREEAMVAKWVNSGHGQIKEEKKERLVFATVPIAPEEPILVARDGVRRISMPADTMHSFDGEKTSIRWVVRAQRIRPRGEPIEYDFPVEVRPPG